MMLYVKKFCFVELLIGFMFNGDGNNDVLNVLVCEDIEVDILIFCIFNCWGELIFE